MFEKIIGKRKSIQRKLIFEFIIAVILVTIFSILGFYFFIHNEAADIIKIQVNGNQELSNLLAIIRRALFIILINTVIISSVIIKLASKSVLKPLEKMVEATKKVADGNFDVRLETERKDEIESLVNNFNRMVKQLGKTETLQKDFIDNVSHEIKTPITSIQGFARLLYDDNLSNDDKKEYIRNYY